MEFSNTLTITILMVLKVSAETQINETRWIENIADKDSAYDKFKFTSFAPSLSLCVSLCSRHIECDACTYNKRSKECRVFDYEDKGIKTVESGTHLWILRDSCRLNFVKVAGFQQCIKYFPEIPGVDWTKAQNECHTLNTELVIVDTEAKLKGLSNYLKDLNVNSQIIIGNRHFLDGTAIKNKECLAYDKEELKKHDCNHDHDFVCQYL